MGFSSYLIYKKCFDWAYGQRTITPGQCNMLIDSERKVIVTKDGQTICMKDE